MSRLAAFFLALVCAPVCPAGNWESALASMPLCTPVRELNRTNCVDVMLRSFQSNSVVKALIFMPGATDELYMFRRARAILTNESASLTDAVIALTNRTLIRASFRSPFLLLHTDEDPLEPLIIVHHPATAERLKQQRGPAPILANDRDWDFLQPLLRDHLHADLKPWRNSRDSWHFYRHSLAAFGLTAWESLEAAALAGKSSFAVHKSQIVFEPDTRVSPTPKMDVFPE
jgi:hypothetical protein